MTKEQLARKRADLERQLADVAKMEKTIAAPAIEVAEMLHDLLCHVNHTDGCAWLYESWEKPGDTRNRFRAKAEHVLRAAGEVADNFDEVATVVAILSALQERA